MFTHYSQSTPICSKRLLPARILSLADVTSTCVDKTSSAPFLFPLIQIKPAASREDPRLALPLPGKPFDVPPLAWCVRTAGATVFALRLLFPVLQNPSWRSAHESSEAFPFRDVLFCSAALQQSPWSTVLDERQNLIRNAPCHILLNLSVTRGYDERKRRCT